MIKTNRFQILMFAAFFLAAGLAVQGTLHAEDLGYDPYSQELKHPEASDPAFAKKRSRNRILARIFEQPLRPINHVIGKTAEWVERHHMVDKGIWAIDELALHGIHPKIKFPNETSFGTVGGQVKVDVPKLLKMEQPFVDVDVTGAWAPNAGFSGSTVELGTAYKIKHPDVAFYHEGSIDYSKSSSESFYGLGASSSLGEWSSYKPEELLFQTSIGTDLSPRSDVKGTLSYQRMNIGSGRRSGVGRLKEAFGGKDVPGIDGGNLLGIKIDYNYDTRDHKGDPKKGGYGELSTGYYHDTDGNDFQYLNFRGNAAHFFKLGSDRRVLAIRGAAEHNQELAGDDVPFFNMARLGGSKTSEGAELLRSYRFNRYFNEASANASIEYRYSVYEYGDFAGDAFALVDIGGVYNGLQNFGFGPLKLSYGGGMNVKFRRHTVLSFVVAHGSEGIEASTHSGISF